MHNTSALLKRAEIKIGVFYLGTLAFVAVNNVFCLSNLLFLLSHPCTKCRMRYCKLAKMSLMVQPLTRLLGLGRASLNMQQSEWQISFWLCICFV